MKIKGLVEQGKALLGVVVEFLAPRYITEYVAFYDDGEFQLVPGLPAKRVIVEKDGEPDGVMQLRSLSWLGTGRNVTAVGKMISWQEYQQLS
ncbi:hypothetical protein ACT3R7_11720 [Halomonas sp. AOP43-A1-21]